MPFDKPHGVLTDRLSHRLNIVEKFASSELPKGDQSREEGECGKTSASFVAAFNRREFPQEELDSRVHVAVKHLTISLVYRLKQPYFCSECLTERKAISLSQSSIQLLLPKSTVLILAEKYHLVFLNKYIKLSPK